MHFTQLPIEEFYREMDRMVRSPKQLYWDLSCDVYNAGLVLRLKKYRYLRWSYLALLSGVVASTLVLVIGVSFPNQ